MLMGKRATETNEGWDEIVQLSFERADISSITTDKKRGKDKNI